MYRILRLLLTHAATALCAVSIANAAPVAGQGTWESTLQARDLNFDGTPDAYYDTSLNITWLANAGVFTGSWDAAMSWASTLNVYGVTGWRLPALAYLAAPGDTCNGTPSPNSSEWQHMYFVTLGDTKSCGGGTSGLSNTGPFVNLVDGDPYWSSTENPVVTSAALDFFTYFGTQSSHDKWVPMRGWAVHDGDVQSIPAPPTVGLLASALVATIAFRTRKKGFEGQKFGTAE